MREHNLFQIKVNLQLLKMLFYVMFKYAYQSLQNYFSIGFPTCEILKFVYDKFS